MKYEQIAELLNGISERFDWEKIMEGDKIIGLKQVLLFSQENFGSIVSLASVWEEFVIGLMYKQKEMSGG